MADEQRDDFERRLLALVRDQLDELDRDWSDGWEITDFVVTARFYAAPAEGEQLAAWEGGPYPGWSVNGFTRGSAAAYFVDAELLQAGLDYTRWRMEKRPAPASDDDGEAGREPTEEQ